MVMVVVMVIANVVMLVTVSLMMIAVVVVMMLTRMVVEMASAAVVVMVEVTIGVGMVVVVMVVVVRVGGVDECCCGDGLSVIKDQMLESDIKGHRGTKDHGSTATVKKVITGQGAEGSNPIPRWRASLPVDPSLWTAGVRNTLGVRHWKQDRMGNEFRCFGLLTQRKTKTAIISRTLFQMTVIVVTVDIAIFIDLGSKFWRFEPRWSVRHNTVHTYVK